ncbi:Zinc finger, CCHC-type [Trema orientale]|uniref:Zinc finger, CCHC-type n=1 Tax=Trema orientale TaxID=63057 RepID=A0A2P5DV55_TREOI|nr:Zinc finger, CCHC-type [Trema orientale]
MEKNTKDLESVPPVANMATQSTRGNYRGGFNGNRRTFHGHYNSGRGNFQSHRCSFHGHGFNGGPNSRGGFSGRGGRGGRWNTTNRPQCQLCGKLGHIVAQCGTGLMKISQVSLSVVLGMDLLISLITMPVFLLLR